MIGEIAGGVLVAFGVMALFRLGFYAWKKNTTMTTAGALVLWLIAAAIAAALILPSINPR